MQEFSEPDK